jgi:hypothetical protein
MGLIPSTAKSKQQKKKVREGTIFPRGSQLSLLLKYEIKNDHRKLRKDYPIIQISPRFIPKQLNSH